jgi:hypothetical protein
MKVTIDIPDELYRQVKVRSALVGRAIRDVTIELYQRWLGEGQPARATKSQQEWLQSWLAQADEYMTSAPPGPTARQILEEDRNRLEPR